jgi:hypothetical protein
MIVHPKTGAPWDDLQPIAVEHQGELGWLITYVDGRTHRIENFEVRVAHEYRLRAADDPLDSAVRLARAYRRMFRARSGT